MIYFIIKILAKSADVLVDKIVNSAYRWGFPKTGSDFHIHGRIHAVKLKTKGQIFADVVRDRPEFFSILDLMMSDN